MADDVYRPGEQVPHAGIYQVTHYQHRLPHEAVIKPSQAFPNCRVCGRQVRFRQMRSASPIELDRDFEAGEAAPGAAGR